MRLAGWARTLEDHEPSRLETEYTMLPPHSAATWYRLPVSIPALREPQFAAVPTARGFDHAVLVGGVGGAAGVKLGETAALGEGLSATVGATLAPALVGDGEAGEALVVQPAATTMTATAAARLRPFSMRVDICATPQQHVSFGDTGRQCSFDGSGLVT